MKPFFIVMGWAIVCFGLIWFFVFDDRGRISSKCDGNIVYKKINGQDFWTSTNVICTKD